MTKFEAWYRRTFFFCTHIYDPDLDWKLGHVFYRFKTQPIEYVYVGRNKLWAKKLNCNLKTEIE